MTRHYLLLYRSRCSTEYSIVRYLITNPAALTLEICTYKLIMNFSKIAGDISEIAGDPATSEQSVKKIIINSRQEFVSANNYLT